MEASDYPKWFEDLLTTASVLSRKKPESRQILEESVSSVPTKLSILLCEENITAHQRGEPDSLFLDIGCCALINCLPEVLNEMTWLEKINLGYGYYADSEENFEHCKNGGMDNEFDDFDFAIFKSLPNLKAIYLGGCKIASLKNFPSLPNLLALELGGNELILNDGLPDFQKLETIGLNSCELDEIFQITKYHNLITVDASHNKKLESIKDFEKLKRLQHLNLNYGKIADFSPIANLLSIKTLRIQQNKLPDLSILVNLINLERLELEWNEFEGHETLAQFKKLKHLDISCCKFTDLSPLAGLYALEWLDLGNNKFSDLSPLRDLIKLEYLQCSYDDVTDVTPLSKLVNLKVLWFQGHQIGNILPLANLLALEELTLNNMPLADLEVIRNFTRLTKLHLDLDNEKEIDLSFVSGLVNLKELQIYKSKLNLEHCKGLKKLEYLKLSHNNLTDISGISGLPALIKLEIINNPLSDLGPISTLPNLVELDVARCKIEDLSPLTNLLSLEILRASQNKIQDITPLRGLANLRMIEANYNQIEDIGVIVNLVNLQQLYVNSNWIRHFDPTILELSQLDEISVGNNPIDNVPVGAMKGGAPMLKSYFEGLTIGAAFLHEFKVIVIGNGGVGKTTFVTRLIDNKFDKWQESTHAIQFREWYPVGYSEETELERVVVNFWDFGGQEIYYSTHRLFLQTDAIFCLLWDVENEGLAFRNERLNNGKVIAYNNYPLHYWLQYIKVLSKKGQTVLIQTKLDRDGRRRNIISEKEFELYNVIDAIALESSRSIANGYPIVKETLLQLIREKINQNFGLLPKQWVDVRELISGLEAEGTKSISVDEFNQICAQCGLENSSTESVLSYFHNIGILFYKKATFEDKVIIDQKWAIEAVYTLLDREGLFARLHGDGTFTMRDLDEIWYGTYSEEEQRLFIDFMLQCEVCFEEGVESLPYWQKRFIAPQLLPVVKAEQSVNSAFHDADSLFLSFQGEFVPLSIIHKFIVKTGHLAHSREIWQYGILLRPDESVATIESYPGSNSIIVRSKANSNNTLLYKIINELALIIKDEPPMSVKYSLDGNNYTLLLEDHRQIASLNMRDVFLEQKRLQNYFNQLLRGKPFEQFKKPKSMPKQQEPCIFFSYSWKGESEKVVTELYDHLKREKFNVIRDVEDLGYKDLFSDFMKRIGKADIVIIPLSDRYLKSKNCMFELYELWRNSKFEKNKLIEKIFPIRIESLSLDNDDTVREYLEYWQAATEKWKDLRDNYDYSDVVYKNVKAINQSMPELLPLLNDLNMQTKEILVSDNFSVLISHLRKRLNRLSNR